MKVLAFFGLFMMSNISTLIAQSDYIHNPSFEGSTGVGLTPPYWHSCNDISTPDTGPFWTNLPPSDGNSYVGLVMRGLMDTVPKNEDVIIIRNLPENSRFIVFDRSGKIVFESEN
jgi:hypothetical protein